MSDALMRIPQKAVLILAGLALCAALYLGSAVLIPVALSLYVAVLLFPAVDFLCGLRLPRMVAAGCVMLALASGIAALVDLTISPAQAWMERAPALFKDVERKLRPLRRAATQFETVAAHAERITTGPAQSTAQPVVATAYGAGILQRTVTILVPLVGAFFMTFFLLGCGPPILQRLAAGRSGNTSTLHFLAIAERARREMGHYLGTITLINIGLGLATLILAIAFDLPNPFLWAVMAALFNYIPYAGSSVTLCVLTAVALLTHEGVGPAVGVAATFLALVTIEGQLVQPLAIGRRLALNPLAVFLALWVGAGLWGIAGMVLATPLLLTTKVICRRLPRYRLVTDFLAPVKDPPIALRARAWQRQRLRERSRRKGTSRSPKIEVT